MSWTITPRITWNESVWNPSMIQTALWLDAADASTVTTVSGAVSQWNDKSGNARHVSQATAGSRPTYSASGLNSKPTIDFDGTNDFLKNASFEPAGALSLFLVFNRDALNGAIVTAQRSNGIFEVSGGFGAGYTNITFTATGAMTNANGFDIAGGGISQNIILGIQYDGSGSSFADFIARFNGTNQAISSSGALGFLSETGFSIGGRPVQDLNYYNGRISELVYIQAQASVLDAQKLEGYLAHKWGLTANLPAGHPYKTVGPTP
jgi:hypothetical protein